ncbi:MAG: acetyltransferase [Acidimicrobiales bacterium]|nr:acetyltransferase [Acidimicrobiales bacterium]
MGPITFRRLAEDDLALLHRWLQDPDVVRWWEGDDVSWEAVQRDYGPGSPDPPEHWLALVDGVEVGWLQCYPALDDPEESEAWFAHGVRRSAAGIDYLIGAPANRGRGLGALLIGRFVEEIVFGRHPAWTQVCASPLAANTASWRALEKAGFRPVATLDDATGPCTLMVRDRSSSGAS